MMRSLSSMRSMRSMFSLRTMPAMSLMHSMHRILALALLMTCTACAGRQQSNPLNASTPTAVPAPNMLSERMRSVSVSMENEGFRPGSDVAIGFLPNGDRRAEKLALPANTCVALVALASAGMIDLDAGLYSGEGEALLEDDNADARPVLSLCTGDHAREVYYTLHAYQGGGAFVARSFVRAQRPDDRSFPAQVGAPSGAWVGIANRLLARGFTEEGAPLALELGAGDALRVALHAEAAHCYALVAEVDPALVGTSLRVMDLAGLELARAYDDSGPLALQFCAAKTQDLALMFGATGGHGGVRLSRYRATEETAGGRGALWLGEPRH